MELLWGLAAVIAALIAPLMLAGWLLKRGERRPHAERRLRTRQPRGKMPR